ncbi:anion permease [Candidatus Woesearchaeota archaeon CG10_big_fil_rev_8_21_14_0_10_44_13]|nr:MAG: anion permease [Candidatus Woesearchaeota archaeon CG10_big_fil_rev_8_21_14_0_10_44_13]
MVSTATLVLIGIFTALLFDFINGFHDAANAIATVVITKVLKPHQAVLMAALANFVGAFVFSVAVAKMIGKGIVNPSAITIYVILAALAGAIIWDLITWVMGLPTSSSHALIGGLIGSVFVTTGIKYLNFMGIMKVFFFIFVAPVMGMIGAAFFAILIINLFRNHHPLKLNKIFKRLQLASSFFYSVGHGTNDAQKSMGIITLLLFSAGYIKEFEISTWVILSCHAAIALGTYFGGWKIVKTMGTKITKLRPFEGFCSESSGGIVLLVTAWLGIPVSTTHVIAGSIMGVGTVENFKTVRWATARRIVWAWLLTIPISALIAAGSYMVIAKILI